jgi:hypothetical protein
MDASGLVDAEPVLRHSGGTKKRAVVVYQRFVEAGVGHKSRQEYYRAVEGRVLGGEGFLKEVAHRVGEHRGRLAQPIRATIDELLRVAEGVSGLKREELCSNSKRRGTVAVKEAVIVLGRRNGIRGRDLAAALGVDPSAVTRRIDAARSRDKENPEVAKLEAALRTEKT